MRRAVWLAVSSICAMATSMRALAASIRCTVAPKSNRSWLARSVASVRLDGRERSRKFCGSLEKSREITRKELTPSSRVGVSCVRTSLRRASASSRAARASPSEPLRSIAESTAARSSSRSDASRAKASTGSAESSATGPTIASCAAAGSGMNATSAQVASHMAAPRTLRHVRGELSPRPAWRQRTPRLINRSRPMEALDSMASVECGRIQHPTDR